MIHTIFNEHTFAHLVSFLLNKEYEYSILKFKYNIYIYIVNQIRLGRSRRDTNGIEQA